jgi:nucleoside-diphosphate-sugar epimerase
MTAQIATESQLDELLSEPTAALVETMRRTPGDFALLGAAGKMGPTLARMVRRASDLAGTQRRVIAVSRFSSGSHAEFTDHGIEAVACDLLDRAAVERLPDAANVVFMAGRKFGSTGDEATTWAMNAYLPALVCQRYAKSRIVAFSTGNVYGLVARATGGSCERDTPCPVGEYAMSALGRERMFEYFSRALGIPLAIIRLNYACEVRYGVLVDLAQKICAGESIDLGISWFNVIWQRDANEMTLRAFEHVATPPRVFNVTGAEILSVRAVCDRLAERLNRPVRYIGAPTDTALLSNAHESFELLGKPTVSSEQMIDWVADWVARGGRNLGKPTHFESRDGKF